MKNVTEADRDSGLLSNPLSLLHSGFFYWNEAILGSRGSGGLYWSLRSSSTATANLLGFSNTGLLPQDGNVHGFGFAVRFVVNPSPLSLILAIL